MYTSLPLTLVSLNKPYLINQVKYVSRFRSKVFLAETKGLFLVNLISRKE